MSKKTNTAVSFSFLIIVGAILWSFISLMPGEISDLDTPKDQFSTERALVHLKKITKAPHFVGSAAHQDVQNYIVTELKKLGLDPQIQKRTVASVKWAEVSVPENVIARIKGTNSSKALVLMSHYDSDPSASFGASDAGSGVVTILESLRAYIASGEKPKNDIIILIDDSEEIGLNGALAFVRHHKWAKDVGLVLNFEARGSGGPSFMLVETNGGNEKLIKQFAKAKTKYPVATSLAYSIYKMLPNDTDLTVFREQGDIEGFNFAFIDDHHDYHTALDTYENLDRNTLEHQGSYLVPLLKYFANSDLSSLKSDQDYIYFNFPVVGMIFYPFSWIMPMLATAIVLFLIIVIIGIRRKTLSMQSIGAGFIAFFLSFVLAGGITFYSWKFISYLNPQYKEILQGFPYNGHFYILGFGLLALFIFCWVYSRYFKKHDEASLFIAPLFIWLLINGAIFKYLQGAGFFIFPVFFGLMTLAVLVLSNFSEGKKLVVSSILSLPMLLVLSPFTQMFPVALGLKVLYGATALLAVLIMALLIPVLAHYNLTRLRYLFLVVGLGALGVASFKSDFNDERKKPNSIMYIVDADENKAYWSSYDSKPDEWTKQFFGDDYEEGSQDVVNAASKYSTGVRMHKLAKVEKIPIPIIETKSDTVINGIRNLAFTIHSQRKVHRLSLFSENEFQSLSINGEPFLGEKIVRELRKPNLLTYYKNGTEDVNISFKSSAVGEISIVLYESAHNLLDNPYFKVTNRPANMIPKPFILNDAIVVRKEIRF